jgi:dihydrofolate reductase
MGRIIVAAFVSIDGYTSGAGGDLSQLPLDETYNQHNADRIRAAARLMYATRTFHQMVAYWPSRAGAADASPAEREIADRIAAGMPVIAVGDSLTEADLGPWRDQASIVRRSELDAEIARLRALDGDTLVFGSLALWTDLLARGLVDELFLQIGPKIVAGDRHTFAGVPSTPLQLVDVIRYDGSGSVVLHYEVER